jgi:hypothetical protein
MIGRHCGERLVSVTDNPLYFRKRCVKCGATFKQSKRQAKVTPCGADHKVVREVGISDCAFGCKVYGCACHKVRVVIHSVSYGCPLGVRS